MPSGRASGASAADRSAWSESIRRAVADPASGLTRGTVSILGRAADQGSLPFALYEESVQQWASCLRALGFTPHVGAVGRSGGVDRFDLSATTPPGYDESDLTWQAVAQGERTCRTALAVVESFYISQPSALAEQRRVFEQYRGKLHSCLEGAGSVIAEEASLEVYEAELERLAAARDCAVETGYAAVR